VTPAKHDRRLGISESERVTGPGSVARLVFGALLLLAAAILAIYGFLRLGAVLEGGGYGTPAVRQALVILGLAGAAFAAGIAILIWEISQRYRDPE
jgi:hypothetical protein